MRLVIDANELFSAMIAKGRGGQTKKLGILFSDNVELFAPTLLFRELERNEHEIREKSGLSASDFEVFVGLIKLRVKPVSEDDFSGMLPEAKKICPHTKDIPYFAAALKLGCPVWSGEKRLKEQTGLKVLDTKELAELLG